MPLVWTMTSTANPVRAQGVDLDTLFEQDLLLAHLIVLLRLVRYIKVYTGPQSEKSGNQARFTKMVTLIWYSHLTKWWKTSIVM